jgi:photosystem II stability/assembly factor-like uncharacterized protein
MQRTTSPRSNLHAGLLLILAMLIGSTPASPRSWESLGPEGGDRFMVRISPADPRTIFVVGHHGVHRSRDSGESWVLVNDSEMGRDSFLDIAFFAANPRGVLVAGARTGVWYSPDEGDHWEARGTGLPPVGGDGDYFPVTSLVQTSSGALMAGLARSPTGEAPPGIVYRSNDLGLTWARHDTGIDVPSATSSAVPLLSRDAAGRVWGMVYGSGVYFYRSGSWRARNANLPTDARNATFLAHDPQDRDRILLGTASSWVWESRDGGVSWARLPLPLELAELTVLPLAYTVVIDPNNMDVVVVRANDSDGSTEHPLFQPSVTQRAGSGLYLSADGGTTWARAPILAFRLAPDPSETIDDPYPGVGVVRRSRTWYGTAGGRQSVYRSSDGFATLETKTKGIQTVWMNDVWVHPAPTPGEGPIVIGAAEAGLFRWNGVAGDWSYTPPAERAIYTWGLAADPSDRDAVLYATGNPAWTRPNLKGVYRLPLSCFDQECTSADNQLLSSTGTWGVATALAWPRRIYAAAQEVGMLVSTDGGAHWVERNAGMTLPASVTDFMLDADGIPRLASFRTSNGQPGADPPQPWAPQYGEPGGVYAFLSSTQRWQPMTAISSAVFHLEVVRDDPLEIYAASSTGVYRLRPPGHWQRISPLMLVNDVAVDPRNRAKIYAATRDGVLLTVDGGAHWSDVSDGLPVPVVYALAFDPAEGSLYAATKGGGIQRLPPE